MGFVLQSFGQLMSQIESDPDLIWPVPDSWSMSDAAAAPALFCQVLSFISIMKDILCEGSIGRNKVENDGNVRKSAIHNVRIRPTLTIETEKNRELN